MSLAKRARTDESQTEAAAALAKPSMCATDDQLALSIVEAGTSLKFATLALISCHSASAPSIKEFTDLRTDVTAEANLYKKAVLPLAKQSLQQVKEFMDYFMDLEFEDLADIADDIVKDAIANQKLMTLNKDTHMSVAAAFKKHDMRIEAVLSKCQLEVQAQTKKEQEYRDAAKTKHAWAIGLAFIPGVNLIASPLLLSSGDADIDKAVAAKKESEMAAQAALVVRDTLAVAIKKYTESMDSCAAEFGKIASECEAFANKGAKFSEKKSRAFYKMMRARGTTILDAVDTFHKVCVSAETDLMCLPSSSRPNYVQEWLASKRDGSPSFKQQMLALLPKLADAIPAISS